MNSITTDQLKYFRYWLCDDADMKQKVFYEYLDYLLRVEGMTKEEIEIDYNLSCQDSGEITKRAERRKGERRKG